MRLRQLLKNLIRPVINIKVEGEGARVAANGGQYNEGFDKNYVRGLVLEIERLKRKIVRDSEIYQLRIFGLLKERERTIERLRESNKPNLGKQLSLFDHAENSVYKKGPSTDQARPQGPGKRVAELEDQGRDAKVYDS